MKALIKSKLVLTLVMMILLASAIAIPLAGTLTHAYSAPWAVLASGVTITEFPIPTSQSSPQGIASGPDGNLWFTELGGNKIGRITPTGTITEYPIPTSNSQPWDIASGPDGNLWFTESNGNNIGRITTSGTITEFPIPTSLSLPADITSGPDGNLWFTENQYGKIGRITPSGTITEFPVTPSAVPEGITSGPDGNLWFTEVDGNQIGRITPTGTITEFPIPTSQSCPEGITSGPDGNLWFTEQGCNQIGRTNQIGRITPSGTFTEYPIPTSDCRPTNITSGPDGNLWFTESFVNQIGRITPSGTFTEYPIPTGFSIPWDITSGPDSNLWFTERNKNQIGRVNLPSPTPTVTVQKVWAADGNNKTQTSFTPGDAIHYRVQVNNTNSTTVAATFTFLATGPRQIFSWSGSKSVASGTSTITKASAVPFDAPAGQYTLTVTVTYNGVSSQGQGQFTVTRPYNSAINNLRADTTTDQSETTIAVSSVNSPGLTVMVAYNDFRSGEGTGYSYSFDGGTRWTDAGAPPVYQDSSGAKGANGGDPALTVDKNGTFYLAQIEYAANYAKEFIGMSKCTYSSSTGKISCARPKVVSSSVAPCTIGGFHDANDKPGITYDPVNNRVYITWTLFTFDSQCNATSTTEMLRYYDVGTGKFSIPYPLDTLPGNGTAPIVTSSGLVYVFFLQTTAQGQGQAIDYTTFNNGAVATYTLDNIYPVAQIQSTCGDEAFTTQAFANNHYARTNEFPAAAVDKDGNIDVVWEGATSNGGISTIFVATLPSGGGTPTIQYLPNPSHLIQWQPAIAFAGGTNTLAVTYFQVVSTSSGYQIVREQVTAPASSVPTFGAAKMISTVSWNALPTNDTSNNTPCYEGDYSSSVSTPTANVVWSYWGDNRNGSQADVYGLFVNVP